MTTTEKLIEIALPIFLSLSKDELLDTLTVDALQIDSKYDWESCVDEDVRNVWGELTLETKLVAYIDAASRLVNSASWDD